MNKNQKTFIYFMFLASMFFQQTNLFAQATAPREEIAVPPITVDRCLAHVRQRVIDGNVGAVFMGLLSGGLTYVFGKSEYKHYRAAKHHGLANLIEAAQIVHSEQKRNGIIRFKGEQNLNRKLVEAKRLLRDIYQRKVSATNNFTAEEIAAVIVNGIEHGAVCLYKDKRAKKLSIRRDIPATGNLMKKIFKNGVPLTDEELTKKLSLVRTYHIENHKLYYSERPDIKDANVVQSARKGDASMKVEEVPFVFDEVPVVEMPFVFDEVPTSSSANNI